MTYTEHLESLKDEPIQHEPVSTIVSVSIRAECPECKMSNKVEHLFDHVSPLDALMILAEQPTNIAPYQIECEWCKADFKINVVKPNTELPFKP